MSEAPDPMSWLNGGSAEGWGAVNREGLNVAEAASVQAGLLAEYDLARLYHDVLANGRGPELMEHLRETLLETPFWKGRGYVLDAEGFQFSAAEWAMIRSGQNSVLLHFRAMLDRARMGPPKVEATAKDEDDAER